EGGVLEERQLAELAAVEADAPLVFHVVAVDVDRGLALRHLLQGEGVVEVAAVDRLLREVQPFRLVGAAEVVGLEVRRRDDLMEDRAPCQGAKQDGPRHSSSHRFPRKRSRPSTSARILRSATERCSIQKPQSGCTQRMRSTPSTLAACSIDLAISAG